MRALISNKNISSNQDKKISSRFNKPILLLSHSEGIHFDNCSELILNTNIFPVTVNLLTNAQVSLNKTISLTHYHLVFKNNLESNTLSINMTNKKWVRVVFGEEVSCELRRKETENKVSKDNIFTSLALWKTSTKEEMKQMVTICAKQQFKEKGPSTKISSKKSLPDTLVTNKLSQRTGSFNQKRKLPSLIKESNLTEWKSKNIETLTQKPQYFNNMIEVNSKLRPRDTSTSVSVRPEFIDSRASKKMKRWRDLIESKVQKSQKETTIDGVEDSILKEYIPSRPKFYQNLNISQEQFELRKRKFDSQFISTGKHQKEAQDKISIGKMPQSESKELKSSLHQSSVAEEICKMADSKLKESYDDTLEQGFRKEKGDIEKQLGQSEGTLYESVYE